MNVTDYINGGYGSFTLKSLKSDKHYTYRTNWSGDHSKLFVKLLTNADTYQYLGMITPAMKLVKTKATKNTGAPFKALEWFLTHMDSADVEFLQNGKCCRCGRELTTPKSIELGMGSVCAEKV